ncbi:MAG: 3-hydroxyacyl-CoA dehydrogenase NAD-binding domain-containing protein [Anaerolineae bacterium]
MKLGIVGAGTMGSGIAVCALTAGFEVCLVDLIPDKLTKARTFIDGHLNRAGKRDAIRLLTLTNQNSALADREVVIEAAIEDRAVKQQVFRELAVTCSPGCIFATNTNTIPVTVIASVVQNPERVIGMHFFNPAPLVTLVEVITTAKTSRQTRDAILQLARQMGKTPVSMPDMPGFLVNRVVQAYTLESLRIVSDGVATPQQVDTILELAGGFKMGPFRMMDLMGIDVSLSAAQNIYEQTFNEPRYRPSLLQAQAIHNGWLGRKTGRGFYGYGHEESPFALPTVPPVKPGKEKIYALFRGWSPLVKRAYASGYSLVDDRVDAGSPPNAPMRTEELVDGLNFGDLHVSNTVEDVIAYDGLLMDTAKAITLSAGRRVSMMDRQRAEAFMNHMGLAVVWVNHVPGHILSRVLCQIINEAAFAMGDRVVEDERLLDTAIKLGANTPAGPFEWLRRCGITAIRTRLNSLYDYYQEERYRMAPYLKRVPEEQERPRFEE